MLQQIAVVLKEYIQLSLFWVNRIPHKNAIILRDFGYILQGKNVLKGFKYIQDTMNKEFFSTEFSENDQTFVCFTDKILLKY